VPGFKLFDFVEEVSVHSVNFPKHPLRARDTHYFAVLNALGGFDGAFASDGGHD
jgi:hypothetical protein